MSVTLYLNNIIVHKSMHDTSTGDQVQQINTGYHEEKFVHTLISLLFYIIMKFFTQNIVFLIFQYLFSSIT